MERKFTPYFCIYLPLYGDASPYCSKSSKEQKSNLSSKFCISINRYRNAIKPGEFVGKAKNANITKFQTRFKPYTEGKAENVDLPRVITKEDIEENYEKIIREIKSLI